MSILIELHIYYAYSHLAVLSYNCLEANLLALAKLSFGMKRYNDKSIGQIAYLTAFNNIFYQNVVDNYFQ